jgi:hypothetical protein
MTAAGKWVYVVSPDEWTFAHHIPDPGGEGWRRCVAGPGHWSKDVVIESQEIFGRRERWARSAYLRQHRQRRRRP